VSIYRPARDEEGRILRSHHWPLPIPATVRILAPLLAGLPVGTFGVASLSIRYRLLAWHVVSRGTRDCTTVSIPEVFVPACVTPGTIGLIVAHNHPSGDPTPSADDVALTDRLASAGNVLGLTLLDHLIVGDEGRFYSFRETGLIGRSSPTRFVNAVPGLPGTAELHFTEGVLEGLKLIGFSVWERKTGTGRNVTFPARQYSVNGERRSFALLRPIGDTRAQERIRDLVLQAYAEYEERSAIASNS
jgi:RadC-like JAB domain